MNPNLFQMGWLQDFKEFSDGTTAHGVKYIFHPSVHGNFKVKVVNIINHLQTFITCNRFSATIFMRTCMNSTGQLSTLIVLR